MAAALRRTRSFDLLIVGAASALVLAGAALALTCLYVHAAGLRNLESLQKTLAADGTVPPIADIVPPPAADAVENGRKFAASASRLSDVRAAHPYLFDGPLLVVLSSPGVATSAVRQPAPLFSTPPSASSSPPQSWDQLRLELEASSAIRQDTREILRQPIALRHDYSSLRGDEYLSEAQQLAVWLRSFTLLQLHQGDISGALDCLAEIRQLSDFVGAPRTLVLNLLATGIWSFSFKQLAWEFLQSPSLTDSDLARLSALVQGEDFVASAIQAMQIEAAILPVTYREMRKSPEAGLSALLPQVDPAWLFESKPGEALRAALWCSLWADSDQARALDAWASAIKNARDLQLSKNWTAACTKFATPAGSASLLEKLQSPVSLALGGIDEEYLRSAVRAEAHRQLLLTAIALERYFLKNGSYPSSLPDLIPAYLPSLPPDWYDGKPLKYRPLSEGSYLLYSVGQDGHDDGGDATPNNKSAKPLSMDSGRDLVWPRLQK